jgi:hypothetical protein
MSDGEQKTFCWSRPAAPVASVSLIDVMSEELAVQLHKDEERAAAAVLSRTTDITVGIFLVLVVLDFWVPK